ncbi:MAG TPA: hypothetical protein VHP63_07165 [candidate division Zixibacteria bacterium]|nr:hypothetical protein [candidate division Zixibacteria bacterium]
MLYTNVEKVKQHLLSVFPVAERIFDQPVILTDIDYVTFFGGAIDEQKLKVKTRQSNGLKKVFVTLGVTSTTLPDSSLVRNSVVAASDSSLGTVYVENVDYIIDYSAGILTIKSGGALTPGQDVTVWYGVYITYNSGSDYIVNSSDGSLRRTSNSDIASGETVYLDYAPIIQSYNDVIIQNAVDEANGLIEKTIDPEQQFGVEPLLQIAATYRAVEIVSRASAARELSSQRGEYNVALSWIKLADEFARRSDELLKSFRPPVSGPSAPAIS